MRKIIFRGKRLDTGEWVEGAYCKHDTVKVCFTADDPKTKHLIIMDGFCDWGFEPPLQGVEVDPATVGQCTGLKDKNGKWIFEGDMLKPFDDEIDKMMVEFHNGSFLLCLYGERGYMGEGGWVEEGNYGVIECEPLSSYGDDVEVIGNIHDNPELQEATT